LPAYTLPSPPACRRHHGTARRDHRGDCPGGGPRLAGDGGDAECG
jgi:hypothetical protein